MALDNPRWGYTRIQGALGNLGHKVGRGTVANVLKANGIEPAPERGKHTRWSTFLKAHWRVFAASDFFSIEVWTGRWLVTHYVLFVIGLADRIVEVLGSQQSPTGRGSCRSGAILSIPNAAHFTISVTSPLIATGSIRTNFADWFASRVIRSSGYRLCRRIWTHVPSGSYARERTNA